MATEPIAKGGHLTLTKLDGVDEPVTVHLDQIQLEQVEIHYLESYQVLN